MYFRKMRPRTTCLYSAASMLLPSLSAVSQSLASKSRLADEEADLFREEGEPAIWWDDTVTETLFDGERILDVISVRRSPAPRYFFGSHAGALSG